MAELINLRTARKQKQRKIRAREAEDNRRKYGRSKTEKKSTASHIDRERARLDGHKLSSPASGASKPADD